MDPKKKRVPGFLSPHLVLCVVLAVMCAAMVFTNLRMNRRISAFNDALEELRREGKETSVRVSDVSDAGLGARKKRSASNATPSKQNFEKRLQAVEERIGALFNKSEMFSTKFGARRLFSYLIRGRDGRDGKDGPAGPAGLPGKPGIPGNPGVPGFRAGRPGKAGPPGKPGQPGNRGLPGKAGSPGKTGQPGNSGLPGKVGPKGEVGKPGINKPFPGPPGPKGEKGPVGNPGSRGTRGHKGEKGQKGAGKSGVKYVRWGRTTCPGSAQIVYKGIIGGEHYNHLGGGVNYLCLPHNPKYDKYNDGNQHSGYMYGTEYEVYQYNNYRDPFKRNIHNHEAPCVACFVKSRGSMLMMPARNDCPPGWTEEYHGYLMTSYYGHNNQKDFICVDKSPEYVPGSHANRDGALLYPVEGACGSLPCLPYVSHRELTCAVCTK